MKDVKKKVSELRINDQFYWGGHPTVVIDIDEVPHMSEMLGYPIYSLVLRVPELGREGAVQTRGDQLVTMVGPASRVPGGKLPALRSNPHCTRTNSWSRHRELSVGRREEMEHTRSPRVARRIAEDHLREDPHYYEKLQQCGLIQGTRGTRGNPQDGTVQTNDVAWYERFHGVPPSRVLETQGWLPGTVVLLGTALDVGYRINDPASTKEVSQDYVHEHDAAVKVYRRAKAGEKPTRTWQRFPKTLRVLGYHLGFSYKDKNGDIHEVKGSRRQYLATTPSSKMLVVVSRRGVEYVLEGGKLSVQDWIYH